MSATPTRLTFVSKSELKLSEYRELLRMPNLRREPMPTSESTTPELDQLVREKCKKTLEYVDPPFFVEHTALSIEVLGGWPGVTTEPFLSRNSNAALLKMLAEYKGDQRRAVVRIAIGYLSARGAKVKVLEAETVGHISDEVRGGNGFGWDQIFVPEGEVRTYAEMTPGEKNKISMRAKVAESFRILLGESSGALTTVDVSPRPQGGDATTNLGNSVVRVFVSYSHEDRSFLEKRSLLGYLLGLEREGFEFWHDRKIAAGEIWETKIREQLERTDIALALVSQAFLNSRFCTDVEVQQFINRRAESGLVIFPVVLSPCDWRSHAWLAATQFEPREGRTIRTNYRDKGRKEELYLRIWERLRELGREIRKFRAGSSPGSEQ
jgi:XTP/dITP diphosphohydrolase